MNRLTPLINRKMQIKMTMNAENGSCLMLVASCHKVLPDNLHTHSQHIALPVRHLSLPCRCLATPLKFRTSHYLTVASPPRTPSSPHSTCTRHAHLPLPHTKQPRLPSIRGTVCASGQHHATKVVRPWDGQARVWVIAHQAMSAWAAWLYRPRQRE